MVQGVLMDQGDSGPSLQTHYNRHVLVDLTLGLLQDSNWCDLPWPSVAVRSRPRRLSGNKHIVCSETVYVYSLHGSLRNAEGHHDVSRRCPSGLTHTTDANLRFVFNI